MSKTFYMADSHFNHSNIIKYCGRNEFLAECDAKELQRLGGNWHDGEWKGERASNWRISKESVKIMDDTIIDNINKTVGENDILYHLGDFCFAPKNEYYKTARSYRDRINCKEIYFIWGNHDSFQIRDLFNGCYDILNINVNNQRIVLCHYAMLTWDKSHRAAWNLYGHSHSNLESFADKVMPDRRSMDVGIDNAKLILGDYRPFSFEEIAAIMGKRKGFFPDHHGNNRGIVKGATEEEIGL